MKRLGERIRRKREGLHLQLSDLAKQVGISSGALSQIENAKAFPSIFSLKNIADSFYFNSSVQHEVKNINNENSEIIWVITPHI